MKKLIILAILISAVQGMALAQATHTLIVKVEDIKSAEGTIKVSLFNSEESFLNRPIEEKVLKAQTGEMSFEFTGLQKGNYTVSVYHDINGNGQLDKNFIGIPSEPYGISMDGKSNFGPPNYEDALFTLQEADLTLKINL